MPGDCRDGGQRIFRRMGEIDLINPKDAARAELKFESRVQPSEISVSVKDGVVMLTGYVDSYLKKWSAEKAAHRVRGVKAVANDIEVRCAAPPSGPMRISPRRRFERSSGTR
jgi:hypothetical protein